MTQLIKPRIWNAILCEDIRDELGGKHSLMGVFSGDLTVPSLPGAVQIACYMQYLEKAEEDRVFEAELKVRADDIQIALAKMEMKIPKGNMATLILPKGFVTLEKEATITVSVSINGEGEEEIIRKKISIASS